MKKFILLILILFSISLSTYAQSSSSSTRRVWNGGINPSTCSPSGSNVFLNTVDDLLYVCTATNTWTAVGVSGGTPSGSNTQVQYNNSSSFGGISNATTDGTTLILTSPKIITSLNDTNGNELFKFTATTNAINEFTIINASTGNHPSITASGGDSNINIDLIPKGTGVLRLNGFNSLDQNGSVLTIGTSGRNTVIGGLWTIDVGSGNLRSTGSYQVTFTTDTGIGKTAAKVIGASDGTTINAGWFTDAGIKRVATQFDSVTTTLANITGLSVTVTAGRTYTFDATLFVDASLVGGSKYAIGGTATATSIVYQINLVDNTSNSNTITSRQTALAGASGQAGTTTGYANIHGTITVNAGGTLTVQFAQNVANGTSSVLVGSDFIVKDNP
jgi:hypothetical protein